MQHRYVELKLATESSINIFIRQAEDKKSLAGLALLTDDDLGSLLCATISNDELAAGPADLLFMPTEWQEAPASLDLRSVSRTLFQMAQDDSLIHDHVEQAFSALVDALLSIKKAGHLTEDTFLSVLSTDPGPRLLALEDLAAQKLNSRATYLRRQHFIEQWSDVPTQR